MKRKCRKCGNTWHCDGKCGGECLCISCYKFHKNVSPSKRFEVYDVCFPNWREKVKVKVVFT